MALVWVHVIRNFLNHYCDGGFIMQSMSYIVSSPDWHEQSLAVVLQWFPHCLSSRISQLSFWMQIFSAKTCMRRFLGWKRNGLTEQGTRIHYLANLIWQSLSSIQMCWFHDWNPHICSILHTFFLDALLLAVISSWQIALHISFSSVVPANSNTENEHWALLRSFFRASGLLGKSRHSPGVKLSYLTCSFTTPYLVTD